jgi:uncharacterized protein YfaS (alpha-2-macroglobulin family)
MQHRPSRFLRLLLPLIFLILGCPAPAPPPAAPDTGFTILGMVDYLAPGSQASLLVQVHEPYTDVPRANTGLEVALGNANSAGDKVFLGETDERGFVQVNFAVPTSIDDPNQMLTLVAAESPTSQNFGYGVLTDVKPVYLGYVYNVLVSTDKPVYQPGQTIHIRGLALDSNALAAAQDEPLTITVQDPSGNKLMREVLTTSEFGVASIDFVLDALARSGDYAILAEMGPTMSSRSVEVKPYQLPRFEVTFESDHSFYLPGDTATGEVRAHYFFGKPVAGSQVQIKGYPPGDDRQLAFELSGATDADGLYRYQFAVPASLAGQLDNRTAQVDLEITVVDTANHAETIDETVTVTEKAILVKAIPESGAIRPGLENIVYLHTTYPDGTDAQTELTIVSSAGTTETVATDAYGLATITVTIASRDRLALTVNAIDPLGHSAEQHFAFGAGPSDAVLLRPDKAEYQVGETMNVDLWLAGDATTAYLDIIKGRQSFGLVELPVQNGRAQAAIPLDGSLLGTLELNAYAVTGNGTVVSDRRLALVNPAPASVDLLLDADSYRPGETATLDVAVLRNGEPMTGVLGISIVDESVFALGQQDPGFARTYFLLERQLQESPYNVHGFAPLNDDDPSPYDRSATCSGLSAECGERLVLARQQAQQMALAGFFAEELAATAPPTDNSALRTLGRPLGPQLAWGWSVRAPLVLPLIGLALYNGTKSRRRLLVGLVLLSLASFFYVACSAAPSAPAGAPAAAPAGEAAASAAERPLEAAQGAAQPPRLRQFFPETLFWAPAIQTDHAGRAQIDVPLADSITTWRISVLASDQQGNLGSAESGLRVFQEFFIEPDLPRFLTVGDELYVPVSVFNYLDEAQTIKLTAAAADWFEFTGDVEATLEIAANEVAAAYIPIRITAFGQHEFEVTATGNLFSDAVIRPVEVLPDGQPIATTQNGTLAADQEIIATIPDDAIAGASRITVKLYPGLVSQLVAGLEGLLREPYGCFEQTSSATYPNILVLDYLTTTGQASPEIEALAKKYINQGYQRLVGFEVGDTPGGFSLFGDPPPQTMLTAYGLMEFTDMSRVSYLDPALIERTANFLIAQQNGDGSWRPDGMTIESGLENLGLGDLLTTAYIATALADAGYADSEPVQRAIGYIQAETAKLLAGEESKSLGGPGQYAGPTPQGATGEMVHDPYLLAMVANALVAAGADAQPALDLLVAQAKQDRADGIFWQSALTTWMGSYGDVGRVETTALAAIALMRANHDLPTAQGAINWLTSERDAYGSYYTTQATVLVLKALVLAARGEEGNQDATVTIQLDDGAAQKLLINEGTAELVQQVQFDDLSGSSHMIRIRLDGERSVPYQVITEYAAPWPTASAPNQDLPVRLDVRYDRTELTVNETVGVQAEVELLAPGTAQTLLVDVGLPPGFSPLTAGLDALVEQRQIERYELTGRRIYFYLTNVPSGQVRTLSYQLVARLPLDAQTPSSQAYDYYTPNQQDTDAPQRIVVRLGAPGS